MYICQQLIVLLHIIGKEKMTLNQKIFQEIEKKNLKMSNLAKILNVENSVISAWKRRGTTPPAEYLYDICNFIGMPITELLSIPIPGLTENQIEILQHFDKLPEREQIKWIGKLEQAVQELEALKEQEN